MTDSTEIFRAIDAIFNTAMRGEFRDCGYCRRTGVDPCARLDGDGYAQSDRCPRCGGSGQVYVPPEAK